MRHRTLLSRSPDGAYYVAHDPDVPWLKPSRGRTAEEAVAAFENRLRYVDVERRKSWAQRHFTWPMLLARLSWELFRAAGLWALDYHRSKPAVLRIAVILFVILPLVLAFAVLLSRT